MISRYPTILVILLFFLFIGIGPIPIKIIGLNVDYLISTLLIILILIKINCRLKINNFGYFLSIYFILISPSVIFSEDFIYSFEKYIYALAYAFLAYILSIINISKEDYWRLCKIAITAIILSCILVLTLFLIADYAGEMRFRVVTTINKTAKDIDLLSESVDPNMTAMGLVFLFLFILPGIIKTQIVFKKLLFTLIILLLIISLLILQSRTAFVMIFLAVLTLFVVKNNIRKNYSYIFVLGVLIVTIFIYQNEHFFSLFDRFFNTVEYESQSTGRFDIINNQFSIFLSLYKNIFIGRGYMLSNPHNEYLGNLFNSGLLGFFGFFLLLSFLVISVLRNSEMNHGDSFFAWVMLMPYLFSLGVYGHTKTFWLVAAICLMVSKVKFADKSNLALDDVVLLKCPKK